MGLLLVLLAIIVACILIYLFQKTNYAEFLIGGLVLALGSVIAYIVVDLNAPAHGDEYGSKHPTEQHSEGHH